MTERSLQPARGKRIATLAALAVAFVILLGLGTWQVERLHWKEALIADIEARRTAPPISLAALEAMVKPPLEGEYRRMTESGQFDHTHEQYFLATDDGDVGYHVYTPLILQDGRALFVNRGFVPQALKDPAKRPGGEIGGEVTITGLVRAELFSKPSWLVPENDPAKNLYFWKDLKQMAVNAGIPQMKLVPFFLDADATPNPGGWPKGGVTQIDLPNNHLGYAVTWYGLAAAMVVIAAMAFRKKPR